MDTVQVCGPCLTSREGTISPKRASSEFHWPRRHVATKPPVGYGQKPLLSKECLRPLPLNPDLRSCSTGKKTYPSWRRSNSSPLLKQGVSLPCLKGGLFDESTAGDGRTVRSRDSGAWGGGSGLAVAHGPIPASLLESFVR